MPRGKKNQAEHGHNSGEPLTDDERSDLVAFYGSKIRAQRKKAEAAKVSFEAERDEVNALFSTARGDLRWTRKEFEEVLAAQGMGEAEFLANEARRADRLRDGGMTVADPQLQLGLGDTADEQAAAYNAGRRAGLRGDDPACPDTVAAILRPKWEHGWADGQKELGERLLRAEAFMASRGPKPDPAPVDLNARDEDEDEDANLDEAARKLKKSGFMQRATPDGAGGETQAAA